MTTTYESIPIDLHQFLAGRSKSRSKHRPCYDAAELKRKMGWRVMNVESRVYRLPKIPDPLPAIENDRSVCSIQDLQRSVDRLSKPRQKRIPGLPDDCYFSPRAMEHRKARNWHADPGKTS